MSTHDTTAPAGGPAPKPLAERLNDEHRQRVYRENWKPKPDRYHPPAKQDDYHPFNPPKPRY